MTYHLDLLQGLVTASPLSECKNLCSTAHQTCAAVACDSTSSIENCWFKSQLPSPKNVDHEFDSAIAFWPNNKEDSVNGQGLLEVMDSNCIAGRIIPGWY